MKRFEKRIALVSGAAQGIGLEITRLLATEGATVYGADMNMEGMVSSAERLKADGLDVIPLHLNIADRNSCEQTVNTIVDASGRLELLVNNAGITRDSLLMRMKPEAWDAVISVNLSGTFHLTQFATHPMVSRRFGRIVNLASVVGLMGNAGQANYVASKAGIIGLTKVVAKELALRNITCNAVAPGFITTPMTGKLSDRQREQMASTIPMRRFGTPQDVAGTILFLLSEDAAYITGQCISVNGGMYM